jgi:hypothetical protein
MATETEVYDLAEAANAAYVYAKHLQGELVEMLQRRNAAESKTNWEVIQKSFKRLEDAVLKEQEASARWRDARRS